MRYDDCYKLGLFIFFYDISLSDSSRLKASSEEAPVQYFSLDVTVKPVLRSAKRAPANVRQLNNISDVIFYCSVGERSRALALLNAALHEVSKKAFYCLNISPLFNMQ